MDEPGHVPVMAGELLEILQPQPGQTVLDCTVGRGGHAASLLPRIGPGGRYVGLDLDPDNARYARLRLAPIAESAGVALTIRHTSFTAARGMLEPASAAGADVLLADLGFASNQVDDPARGFSFTADGPLDMRLNSAASTTAADLLNNLPENELADLLYHYGEERLSRKIARKIVERRRASPMHSTRVLAELVRQAYGRRAHRRRINPATRTFLALRIAVNGELDNLDQLLTELPQLLAAGGRAGIISFHSLEDRRVKRAMLALEQKALGQRLTRKPLRPGDHEVAANPRSRSARLRGWRRSDHD